MTEKREKKQVWQILFSALVAIHLKIQAFHKHISRENIYDNKGLISKTTYFICQADI